MKTSFTQKSRFLALVLSLAVVFSSLPFTVATVSAEENVQANTVTDVDQSDTSNPYLTFRVLDTDSGEKSFASSPVYARDKLKNAMLLDCDTITSENLKFSDSKGGWVSYSKVTNSEIRKNFIENGADQSKSGYNFMLSNDQYAKILSSYKRYEKYDNRTDWTDTLHGDKLFLLSYNEVTGYYSYSENSAKIGKTNSWWLRSPCKNATQNYARSASTSPGSFNANQQKAGVSPALNLDLESISFISEGQMVQDLSYVTTASDTAGKQNNPWIIGLQTTTTDMPTVTTDTNTFKVTAKAQNYDNVIAMILDKSTGDVIGFGKINLDKDYDYDPEINCLRIFGYNDIDEYGTIKTSAINEIGTAVDVTPTNIKTVNAQIKDSEGKVSIVGLNGVQSGGSVQSYVSFGKDLNKHSVTANSEILGVSANISQKWVQEYDKTTLTVTNTDGSVFTDAPLAKTDDGTPISLEKNEDGTSYSAEFTGVTKDMDVLVYTTTVISKSANIVQKDASGNISIPGIVGIDIKGNVQSYINYGWNTASNTALKFRVLDTDSGKRGGFTDKNGKPLNNAILLDCDSVLKDDVSFNSFSPNALNGWVTDSNFETVSDIRANFIASTTDQSLYNFCFSEEEYSRIYKSYKQAKVKSFDKERSDALNGDKLFLLSLDEASGMYYNNNKARAKSGIKRDWWLRSPDSMTDKSENFVGSTGSLTGATAGSAAAGVSPVLNLDLSPALFTSSSTDIPDFDVTADQGTTGTSSDKAWTLGVQTTDTSLTVGYANRNGNELSFTVNNVPDSYDGIAAVVTNNGTVTKFGRVTPTDGVYKVSAQISENVQIFAYEPKSNEPQMVSRISADTETPNDATIHCTGLAEVKETPDDPTPTPTPVTTTYTITATATYGGTITPSGTVKVAKGKNKSFTATPDDGYTLEKFVVDGEDEYINGNTYTFEKVNAKHTIQAVFTKKEEPQPEPEKFTGWKETNGKWQYIVDDKALTGWQSNIKGWEGQWFYFDNAGIMQTGWVNNIPGWNNWFYFDRKTGVMQKGWAFVDDGHGDFTNKLWYYLDTTTGAMHIDWQKIDGKWYYLDYNRNNWGGAMQTGWQFIPYSGGQAWFCFANNGAMYENCTTPDGYYVDANGVWK